MAKLTYTKEIEIELSSDDIGRYFQELSAVEQEKVFNDYIVPEMAGFRTGFKNACTFVDNLSGEQRKELAKYIKYINAL